MPSYFQGCHHKQERLSFVIIDLLWIERLRVRLFQLLKKSDFETQILYIVEKVEN